jgi:hypothetical protein
MIKPFGYSNGKVYDLEQAKGLNFDSAVVLFDGISVHSYNELVQFTSLDKYKNLDVIEIVLLPNISGG